MKTHALRFVLVAVLWTVVMAGAWADMIPLADLKTERVQQSMGRYLKLPVAKDKVESLTGMVKVDPMRLTVEEKKVGEKMVKVLHWEYELVSGGDIKKKKETVVSTYKDLLTHLFGDSPERVNLLNETEAKELLERVEIVPVNTPPTISTIANSTVKMGETVQVQFMVSDTEVQSNDLKVSGTSSNLELVPQDALVFTGKESNRKLAITPAKGKSGKALITVTVTAAGSPPRSATSAFELTVFGSSPPGTSTQTTRVVWVFSCCGCCWVPVALSTVSTPGSDLSTETSDASTIQTAPAEEPPVYSVVRRKLLLKNRGPEDAVGLNQRAVQAYRSGEYHESLDLAWAAIQLDDQDSCFWFARALSERALGDATSARSSAQHGAALNLLVGRGPLSGSEQIDNAERRFLLASAADVTRANARIITEEIGEAKLPLLQVGNVDDRLGGRGSQSARTALVTLNLPPDAKLSIDGKPFPLPSTQRTFTTPKLKPGKAHFYQLKAEIVRDGQVKTETRKVYVAPGKHVQVDFKSLTEVHTVRK